MDKTELIEAIQQVKIANADRLRRAPGRKFTGSSYDDNELKAMAENPSRKANEIGKRPPYYLQYLREGKPNIKPGGNKDGR